MRVESDPLHDSLPLSLHRIAATTRADEAADIISRSLVPLHVSRIAEPQQFRLDMNGRQSGPLFFGFNRFAADTELDAGHVEDRVAIALGSHDERPSCFEIDDTGIGVSTHSAAVISPGRKTRISRPAGSSLFALSIRESVLRDRYYEITGKHVRGPIIFEPSVDLTQGSGRLLAQVTRALASEIDREVAGGEPTLLEAVLRDALISILIGLPNRFGNALEHQGRPSPEPRLVRLAEEYMAARVYQPIALSDLVSACGCSRSTLYDAFRSSRGYTPMQFLAARRLEIAQERLMREPDVSVTQVALDCGFSNQGRFAKAYRNRFGEMPSETRARCHGPARHHRAGSSTN